jgi:cellulase/cellobiase CelA1
VSNHRDIPWVWIAGGVIALVLVGRGMVGAGLGPGGGSPTGGPSAVGAGDALTVQPGPTEFDQTTGPVPTVAPTTPRPTGRVNLPLASPSETATTTAPATPTATANLPSETRPPTPTRRPAAPSLRCAVRVDLAPYWGGYNATITVRNTGRTPVDGWRLSFGLPDRQVIVRSWNGRFSVHGSSVQVSDAGFNATLPPGGSTQIGYQAQARRPGGPSGFALNGVDCSD